MSDLRSQLGGFKRRFIDVTTPVTGLKVGISNANAREKQALDAAMVNAKTGKMSRDTLLKFKAKYLVAFCVSADEKRDKVFKPGDEDFILDNIDSQDFEYLFDQCNEHVGGSKDDFDEMVGNSEAVPNESLQ